MSKLFNLIGIIILIAVGIGLLYTFTHNKILNTPDGYKNFTSKATNVRFIVPKDYSRNWNQHCATKATCTSHHFIYKTYGDNSQETRQFSYEQYEGNEKNISPTKQVSFQNQYDINWYSETISRDNLLDRFSTCTYRESDTTTHCFEGFDASLIETIAENTQFIKN